MQRTMDNKLSYGQNPQSQREQTNQTFEMVISMDKSRPQTKRPTLQARKIVFNGGDTCVGNLTHPTKFLAQICAAIA
jgi:hypothetical protein